MNPPDVNWTPGFLFLGAGGLAAIAFALLFGAKHKPAPKPATPEDLDARYQTIIGQLKEHAASKHLLEAQEWAAEQARLEHAAAQVLREKAGVTHEAEKAKARAEKAAKHQPAAPRWVVNGLIGAAVIGFFVVLGVVLTGESKARDDGMEMTGKVPGDGARPPMQQGKSPEDAEFDRIREQLARAPDDLEVLSDATASLIRMQEYEGANELVQRATSIDPYHVTTRIHRAVLQAAQGQTVVARAELEHLAATYDEGYPALLFAGALAMESDEPKVALGHFERFAETARPSEVPPMLMQAIAQLRAQVAQRDAGR